MMLLLNNISLSALWNSNKKSFFRLSIMSFTKWSWIRKKLQLLNFSSLSLSCSFWCKNFFSLLLYSNSFNSLHQWSRVLTNIQGNLSRWFSKAKLVLTRFFITRYCFYLLTTIRREDFSDELVSATCSSHFRVVRVEWKINANIICIKISAWMRKFNTQQLWRIIHDFVHELWQDYVARYFPLCWEFSLDIFIIKFHVRMRREILHFSCRHDEAIYNWWQWILCANNILM